MVAKNNAGKTNIAVNQQIDNQLKKSSPPLATLKTHASNLNKTMAVEQNILDTIADLIKKIEIRHQLKKKERKTSETTISKIENAIEGLPAIDISPEDNVLQQLQTKLLSIPLEQKEEAIDILLVIALIKEHQRINLPQVITQMKQYKKQTSMTMSKDTVAILSKHYQINQQFLEALNNNKDALQTIIDIKMLPSQKNLNLFHNWVKEDVIQLQQDLISFTAETNKKKARLAINLIFSKHATIKNTIRTSSFQRDALIMPYTLACLNKYGSILYFLLLLEIKYASDTKLCRLLHAAITIFTFPSVDVDHEPIIPLIYNVIPSSLVINEKKRLDNFMSLLSIQNFYFPFPEPTLELFNLLDHYLTPNLLIMNKALNKRTRSEKEMNEEMQRITDAIIVKLNNYLNMKASLCGKFKGFFEHQEVKTIKHEAVQEAIKKLTHLSKKMEDDYKKHPKSETSIEIKYKYFQKTLSALRISIQKCHDQLGKEGSLEKHLKKIPKENKSTKLVYSYNAI